MLTFAKGAVRGRVTVPGDKSISHRALILGALAEDGISISNLNPGSDVAATALALRAIGAHVELEGTRASVRRAPPHDPPGDIDCMNSGSTARMMMGVVTGANLRARFTGDASLQRRPMEPVAAHLRAFGAKIETTDGTLPATVRGTADPQTRTFILVQPSAQIKTSLLFAAAYAGIPIEIHGDKGSRDHTERLLQAFGARMTFDRSRVLMQSMPDRFSDVTVAGDFSSAAFFIVAACIAPGSDLTIADVGVNPSRTGLLDALELMGARIELQNGRESSGEPIADIRVRSSELNGTSIAADLALRAIDEIPVLCVAAAFARGQTRLTGIADLRNKESDRIAAIERLLTAAGIDVEKLPNGIAVHGGSPQTAGGIIETHGDHRTAMSAGVLAAGAGALAVDDEVSMDVSFPGFATLLEQAQHA